MKPIFFVPFFEDKPWGGTRLVELFGKYPAGIRIAQSWELSAVQFRQTCVRTGQYVGYTLGDLYRTVPELFGTNTPYFPLVIKLMDVTGERPTSINGGWIKSDADQTDGFYVVEAGEDAWLKSGTKLTCSLELFKSIVADTVADSLFETQIETGDSFVVPSGMLYSIGGGQVIYQIASPLRETSLLDDIETSENQELEKALEAFSFGKPLDFEEQVEIAPGITRVLETDLFCLERIDAVVPVDCVCTSVFSAYTALSRGILRTDQNTYVYSGGDTFLVPAGEESYRFDGGVLLKATPRRI